MMAHKDDHSSSSGFWSSDVDGVSYIQLHKFWSELSTKDRQELLRIDRQSLFEQARKNMCCSRCHGLLLEGFLQIVSFQQKGASKDQNSALSNQDAHQWGGLTATRDESLTLLDCYLYPKSFKVIQTVFESARARERERELLYPDACGGDGRVWISQGVSGYGKGYGTREACALHTRWLSCDTLVDFYSALEDESRLSLFTMKEEDFIGRLTSRFDRKKFCRDCRKNVIREFKALKEIKRMQRKPQCTEWFCVADTAFQYQVGIDSVRADWSQYFTENAGYHQFEWAVGTDKGESDILDFKRVGSNRSAQARGLDLHGLKECYITLRAFKKNGRASEISVKAHALGCQQCVHSRLVVGDGFVSIRRGKCIRMFFEHAEEVEEEENEVDTDGNELDGECFRPQKHAKSPELAREFLLDAATVIFKEQVEKAFRDGTARQNAHSIFVCLSSKLLEQRVYVACKEIITLEKQNKLLEEEEKEKREEEERKERKRTKEREKKLRRKERLKEKELEKEQKNPKFIDKEREKRAEEGSMNLDEESNSTVNCEDSGIETGDVELSPPGSPDDQDGECLDDCITSTADTQYSDSTDRDIIDHTNDSPGPAHQTGKFWKEVQPDHALKWSDKCRDPENASFAHVAEARYCSDSLEPSSRHLNGSNKNMRVKALKAGGKPNSIKSHQGFQCSDKRNGERYDDHSCSYKPNNGFWEKAESNISATRGMPVTVRKVSNSTQLKHPRNSSHSDIPPVTCSTFKAEEVVDVALKSAVTQSLYKATEKLGDAIHIDCNKVSGNYISPTEEDKKMEVHITSKNDDMFSKDPMMSRSSSSDNCSSCLSEGDSNTASSNSGNSGSSPMSDLEEKLVDNENDMHDCHEKMIEKETENSIDERDLLRIKKMSNHPAENEESKLSGTPSTVLSQSMDNTVPSVITGSYLPQPQSMMFPQMQSIPLPVFQAPYYHQAPVSWSAASANGLMPFPHPNHYVYAGTLGYSLNGDSPLCLQYGTPLNHSATPFFNSGPAPVFHPFAEINTVNAAEQVQTVEHGYLKEAADERKINRISPVKTPSSRGQETDSGEDFSLFHFGGPVSRGKSSPANPRDGVLRDFSLQFTRDHVFGDYNKKKKEKTVGEEYNLFGESNSLRFSLF